MPHRKPMSAHPNNIKTVRTMRGYSLQQVADLIGADVSTVQRHEAGTRPLTLDALAEYARHLEVPARDLIGEDAEALAARLVAAFKVLPPQMQLAVIGLAEAMGHCHALHEQNEARFQQRRRIPVHA